MSFVVDLGDDRALRPLEDADAEELFAVIEANRAHLAAWMPFVGQTRGVADSLAFVRAARRQYEENRGMQLAVLQGERIIGVAGFHAIDWTRKSTSIGYWLAAERIGTRVIDHVVYVMTAREWRRRARRDAARLAERSDRPQVS